MDIQTGFIRDKKKALLKIIGSVAAVGGLMILIWWIHHKKEVPEEDHTKVVEIVHVKRDAIAHRINLLGTIRPKHDCTLIAKTGGTIDTLLSAGSVLKKGDLIASIENPDIEKTYQLSELGKTVAKSQYDRIQKLVNQGIHSQKEMEDAQNRLIEAKKNLARSSIDRENTRIVAPFDGILGAYKVKDGQQVVSGCPVATFYNADELFLEFDIPSCYASKVNVGQEVMIEGHAFQVRHVQKAIDEESRMCPASVELKASDLSDNMILGTSLDLILTIERKSDVLVLPINAVFLRDGKDVVYVVHDNKTELRPVTLGIKSADYVEISQGVKENEAVVALAQERLFPGMKVKIADKKVGKDAGANVNPNAGQTEIVKSESARP